MNDVIDKAKELANSLIESKEFIEYQKYKDIIETAGLSVNVSNYERALSIVSGRTFPKDSKIFIDAQKLISDIEKDDDIISYVNSKKELGKLLDTVNGILSHITGMETGTSGCGGCGGCNGCK